MKLLRREKKHPIVSYLAVLLILVYSCHKWEGSARQYPMPEYISAQFYTSDSALKSEWSYMNIIGVGFDMNKKYAFHYQSGLTGCPTTDILTLSLEKSQTYTINVLYRNTDSIVNTKTLWFGPNEGSCILVDLK
jgi:hypothetical protein